MKRTVKITHPELGEAQVMPAALPVWLERGWSVEGSALPEASSVTLSDYAVVVESDVTAARDLKKNKQQASCCAWLIQCPGLCSTIWESNAVAASS